MKSFNKYLNIVNLICIVLAFLKPNYFNYYSVFIWGWNILFYSIGFLNIIAGILNIKKKNKAIGIISTIMGLAICALGIVKYINEEYYGLTDEMLVIIILLSLLITIIGSIVNLVKNRKVQQERKSTYAFLMFIAFIISIIGICLITQIMHSDNVKKFYDALAILQTQENTDIFAININSTNEWVLINGEGKELNRNKYNTIIIPFKSYYIENKIIRFAWGVKNKKLVLIDATGEVLWEPKRSNR